MAYLHCLTLTRIPIGARISVLKLATVAIADLSTDPNRSLQCVQFLYNTM